MKTSAKFFKRILSLVLTVLMVISLIPMSVFSASAVTVPTYITDIGIAYSDYQSNAKNLITQNGYTLLDKDLNEGAGGKYIYLGYKESSDSSRAITGMICRVGQNPPDTLTHNNATFHLVGGSSEPNITGDGAVDLNMGAGINSDYIYLYITRDVDYDFPLTSLITEGYYDDSPFFRNGYVFNTSGGFQNFNSGTSGKSIYMRYVTFLYSHTNWGGDISTRTFFHYLNTNADMTYKDVYGSVKNHEERVYGAPTVPNVTVDGYNLAYTGWRDDQDSCDPETQNPYVTFMDGTSTHNPKSFYATYATNITVTYDANGGSGAPSAQSATVKGKSSYSKENIIQSKPSFTISSTVPVKSNTCAFLGWSTDKNATTAEYTAGQSVQFKSSTTLYAVWRNHNYSNGVCKTCNYTSETPKLNSNGYYEIDNAGKLYWFAQQVNSGNTSINAILTADIVVNENLLDANDSLNSVDRLIWTSIGNETNPYAGHFNGNGKTISGLYNKNYSNHFGLFGYLTGTVENLGVVDSYLYGDSYVGTVVGYNKGTVKNCYKTGILYGTAWVGGIVGYNTGTVENCYNYGDAYSGAGVYSGAVVGYNSGTTRNCYYADGDLINTNGYAEKKTAEQFANGEVAYLLGDAFGQTIGTDKLPVLGSAKVYQVTNCKGDTLYSNTNKTIHIGNYDKNGFCDICGNGYQTATLNSNGYYEIDNAGKLYWFAEQVNSGNTSINAILTADIVVNEGNISEIYKTAKVWTPIGNGTNRYTGTFNGNNKTVSGLCLTVSKNYFGLFGSVGTNGVVKNVGVTNSFFSGSTYIGGIVGDNYGTIENCYYIGSSYAGMFGGGIAGHNGDTGLIKNCFFTGNIGGANYSYITLRSEGKIENCYYSINASDSFDGTTYKSIEAFKSGEVAHLLGDAYGQSIGTDEYPVLGSAKVYRVTNCKGDTLYSNTNKTIHIGSYDGNGFCATCGNAYQPATLNSNGYYEISNAGNLMWFAEQINTGKIGAHKVMLTNDIVIPTNKVWTPINLPDGAISTFDGNGHSITMNQNLDNGTTDGASFGLYLSCNYSTIQNLVLKGNVVVNTTGNVGGVSATSYRTTFRNVTSYMNITNNCTTGGNVGGIVGYFGGKHANGLYSLIENCAVYADVSGYIAGGIVGQGWNGTQYYDISNCAYVGNVTGTNIAGAIVGYQNTDSNTSRFTNIYWNEKDNLGFYGLRDTTNQIYTNTEAKTAEQFASGEVAYLLGGSFGQTLGTDDYPVLGGAKVYYGYENCSSTEKAYSNNKMSEEIVPHNYENGICTVCDAYLPATDSDGDSYYEIDNAGKLYWFAQQVNNGNYYINAILTADITVNEGEITENSTDAREWISIGNKDNQYKGIFDGNNKTISGLYYNNTEISYIGLFGYTGEYSKIKNVGIVNSYFNGDYYVGGVVGNNYGTITNCYNSGEVSGNSEVGGVVGINYSTVTNCHNTGEVSDNVVVGGVTGVNYGKLTNCYNTGTVSGATHVGGVAGNNFGPNTTITNCYNTGTISGTTIIGGVVGYNSNRTVTNCYNTGTVSGEKFVGGVVGRSYSGTVTNSYNAGTVSGNSEVGGVVGYESDGSTITNCYYLNTTHTGGINSKDIAGSAEAKTAEQFASGEVAYLLGEAFGQTIGTDNLPVLGGAKVYCGYTDCALSKKAYSNSPIETPAHNHILGDIDLDGIVSIRDVSTLSKYLANCTTLTDCQLSTADANGDGEININDATHIQKMLAELI